MYLGDKRYLRVVGRYLLGPSSCLRAALNGLLCLRNAKLWLVVGETLGNDDDRRSAFAVQIPMFPRDQTRA
jgi:hypothetical protein